MDRTYGKYEVVEKIGEGGFGEVYKGWDPVLKRHVAIKTCPVVDEGLTSRFLREAEISAGLQHPNIVMVHDFGEEGGRPYLVQELLPGEDLGERIARGDLEGFSTRLDWLEQVAAALRYAHEQGVVHRDVKPGNVRIQPDGRVRILDFGIAIVLDAERLTRTGMSVGTAAYLSPEQLDGRDIDGRADIFSFGALAYELLSGRKAFDGPSLSAVIYRVAHEDPPPLAEHAPGCPRAVVALVERCLAKDPGERFQDFGEVAAALAAVRRGFEEGRAEAAGEAGRVDSGGMPIPGREEGGAAGYVPPGGGEPSPRPRRLGRIGALAGLGLAALAVAVFGIVNVVNFTEANPDTRGPAGERGPAAAVGEEEAPGEPETAAGTPREVPGVPETAVDVGTAPDRAPDVSPDPVEEAEAETSGRTGAEADEPGGELPPPDPASLESPSGRDVAGAAAALDDRRLLVVVYGRDEDGVQPVETALLEGLATGGLDVVEPRGLEIGGEAAPVGWDAGSLGAAARGNGAGLVVLATLRTDAQPSVGRFFTGTASLDVRVYRASNGELVGAETVGIGAGRVPGELGSTPAAARDAAAGAAGRAAVGAVRRILDPPS